jgi:hypothetical protein
MIPAGIALKAGFGLKVLVFKEGINRGFKIRMTHGIGTGNFVNPQHPICRCDEKGKCSNFGSFG